MLGKRGVSTKYNLQELKQVKDKLNEIQNADLPTGDQAKAFMDKFGANQSTLKRDLKKIDKEIAEQQELEQKYESKPLIQFVDGAHMDSNLESRQF